MSDTETLLPAFMHPVEISQLTAIVESVAPRRCLEWGSGGSTLHLLEVCPCIERFISVEHDAEWHERVNDRSMDPRLELHLVLPNQSLAIENPTGEQIEEWDLRAEHDLELMRDYVQLPAQLGLTFDFVLVDGRARNFCLRVGFDLLRSGGVMAIHDAQRREYRKTLDSLGRAAFLEPWRQGQICLVRKP